MEQEFHISSALATTTTVVWQIAILKTSGCIANRKNEHPETGIWGGILLYVWEILRLSALIPEKTNWIPIREAQAIWLNDVLKRRDIASAPYLVAFCHIPLFDPRPNENPGDLAPADTAPGFKNDYAEWQRTCLHLWGPALQKAGCQVIITAHQHSFRFDIPEATKHGWAQVVGGGPELNNVSFPTVIEGKIEGKALRITVHNAYTGEICLEQDFQRRR